MLVVDSLSLRIDVGSHASISEASISIPHTNVHLMQTRGKSGTSKKKLYLATFSIHSNDLAEPSSFSKASKLSVWRQAINEKYTILVNQNTLCFTPLPPGKNVIVCKWVYRIKRNPDGNVVQYKVRFVAKGYHKEKGLIMMKHLVPSSRNLLFILSSLWQLNMAGLFGNWMLKISFFMVNFEKKFICNNHKIFLILHIHVMFVSL